MLQKIKVFAKRKDVLRKEKKRREEKRFSQSSLRSIAKLRKVSEKIVEEKKEFLAQSTLRHEENTLK